MLLQHPFEVVTTAKDGPVLGVLAGADSWFTVAQVWELSGVRSRDRVRRVLARLAETGVVDEELVGTTLRYRLNREHLDADAIIAIARTRDRLLERLRSELTESWQGVLVYAALFGSAARGDMHADSDVDILLIRTHGAVIQDADNDVWERRVTDFEQRVRRWTGNPTNVLAFTEDEVYRATPTAALKEAAREGITLTGPHNWLDQALGRGKGRPA